MIKRLTENPTFSLFNNYEIIRKIKSKINEIIDAINNQPEPVEPYEVNYSTEERKIGSYFGEDLYEKTFNITADDYDATSNTYDIDLGETVDKLIDCTGFIYSTNSYDSQYKLKLPINTEPELVLGTNRQTNAIYTGMYDHATVNGEMSNASISIHTMASDYISSYGIIKVQYTKRLS